jgi:hypothetical protein
MTRAIILIGLAFLALVAWTAIPTAACADGYPYGRPRPQGQYGMPYPPRGYYGMPYGYPRYRGPRGGWGRNSGGSVYFPGGAVHWGPSGGSVRVGGINISW